MLIVKALPTYMPEREYIIHAILGEFLGLEYQIVFSDQKDVVIASDGKDELILPDILFQTPPNEWLTNKSLPKQPLDIWDVKPIRKKYHIIDQNVPIVYGTIPGKPERKNYLPVDIFGSAFFMLTRYEELVKQDRDKFERFPVTASLSFQEGFLDRPIVNEYVEILWFEMKMRWPNLKRAKKQFDIMPTHDADRPFKFGLLKPRDFLNQWIKENKKNALLPNYKEIPEYLKAKFGLLPADPYNTFDWIMDVNENKGLKSTFYFFGKKAHTKIDGCYSSTNKLIRKLIKKIDDRGHEIGFHGSSNAYNDKMRIQDEFEELKSVYEKFRNEKKEWFARLHYLRFNIKNTPLLLEKIGISYDSTLAFAELGGFRSGVCYEYPFYDLMNRRRLKLRERPLLIMERSIMSPTYMNLNLEDALDFIIKIKRRCQLFDGSFTFLWHNNMLIEGDIKELYETILVS